MVDPLPNGIPDLGAIGRPQQIQIAATALVRNAPGLPPELVDAAGLTEMIRAVFREEFDRLGLVPHSEYESVTRG